MQRVSPESILKSRGGGFPAVAVGEKGNEGGDGGGQILDDSGAGHRVECVSGVNGDHVANLSRKN